ncbi:MAG: replicative protein [Oenococcus sp.]|uniref:rolling circle replication-associated protein n=1 Tax=Oenococcus sp. TaxID=1979414 RepID=UPI0039ED541B
MKSYRYGQTLELTTANGEQIQSIRVLTNKRYLVFKTGEVKQMNTGNTKRSDNLKTVKSTMRKLRRLIAHNFTGGNNQLWITLTYAKHVTDTKIVYQDFKTFMAKLRVLIPMVDYIAVIEPQANGRWHYHLLLRSTERLSIPNQLVAELWAKGFTKTNRLSKADKVANYVMAYLSNLEIPNSNQTTKKYVKGARLYLYPKGLRIYRRSKGIHDPIEETGSKEKILQNNGVQPRIPDFSRYTTYETLTGEVRYTTEYYDNLQSSQKVARLTDSGDRSSIETISAIKKAKEINHASSNHL